jgi:hypothetical protein
MAARGRGVTFHGAFRHKADAVVKERQVGGFLRVLTVRGQRRYAVVTRNPGGSREWPASLHAPFPTLERAQAYARAIRGSEGAFLARLSDGRYGVCAFPEARRRGWV